MKKYIFDKFTHEDYIRTCAILDPEDNKEIVETAGYIPLEVKFKQFEQNGLIAQFQVQDFDSNDYRDIYLSPDFSITPEDDFEDVQEKLIARNNYVNELKKAKSNGMDETAGTVEPIEEKNPPAAETEEK